MPQSNQMTLQQPLLAFPKWVDPTNLKLVIAKGSNKLLPVVRTSACQTAKDNSLEDSHYKYN